MYCVFFFLSCILFFFSFSSFLRLFLLFFFFFFFFQAEDGIRDVAVTGVQTCALPISALPAPDTTNRKNMLLLIQLRWIAAFGQVVTIAIAELAFGIDLPLTTKIGRAHV